MEPKAELLKILQSQHLMSLATISDRPWISTVFYAVDQDFNLIFSSNPQSRHAQEIMNNSAVAVAICHSEQKTSDDKVGIQIEGIASLITDQEELARSLELWHISNPGMEDKITLEAITSGRQKSVIFKIKPIIAKLLHEPTGQEVIKF